MFLKLHGSINNWSEFSWEYFYGRMARFVTGPNETILQVTIKILKQYVNNCKKIFIQIAKRVLLYEALRFGEFEFQNKDAELRFWEILETRPLKVRGHHNPELHVHLDSSRRSPKLLSPIEQFYAHQKIGSSIDELYTYRNCKSSHGYIKCADDDNSNIVQLIEDKVVQCYGFFYFNSALFLAYYELHVSFFDKNKFIFNIISVDNHVQFCNYSEIRRSCCRFRTISDNLDIVIPITHADEMMA